MKEKKIVLIDKVSNYSDLQRELILNSADSLHILCVGEIIKDEPTKLWENDIAELFFDLNNEKLVGFNSKADDKQILLGEGAPMQEGIVFFVKDVSSTKYIVEAKIPWISLKFIPKEGKIIGFDYAIDDNDYGLREAILTWHSADAELFINTSLYGNMLFTKDLKQYMIANDSLILCSYTHFSPKIDGAVDDLWEKITPYPASKLAFGNIDDSNDLNATIKTMWDQENLYFLLSIKDDIIIHQSNYITNCDYGWIEDTSGKKIWEMTLANSKCAGGAEKNRIADTTIALKKGKYFIHYISDESHSYDSWDDDPPTTKFYGIRVESKMANQ